MYYDNAREMFVIDIDKMINGKRLRKTRRLPKGTTEAAALAIEQQMLASLMHMLKTERSGTWADYVNELLSKKSWLDQALAKCVYRAKQRDGYRCTLTRENIADAMLMSNGRCQITGISFSDERLPGREIRPFRHSIDRIDSSRGYLPDNIRIVCAGVNIAMMHWGEQIFGQFAVGYVLHKYAFISQISEAAKSNGTNHALQQNGNN